jgi:hypothetical protein
MPGAVQSDLARSGAAQTPLLSQSTAKQESTKLEIDPGSLQQPTFAAEAGVGNPKTPTSPSISPSDLRRLKALTMQKGLISNQGTSQPSCVEGGEVRKLVTASPPAVTPVQCHRSVSPYDVERHGEHELGAPASVPRHSSGAGTRELKNEAPLVRSGQGEVEDSADRNTRFTTGDHGDDDSNLWLRQRLRRAEADLLEQRVARTAEEGRLAAAARTLAAWGAADTAAGRRATRLILRVTFVAMQAHAAGARRLVHVQQAAAAALCERRSGARGPVSSAQKEFFVRLRAIAALGSRTREFRAQREALAREAARATGLLAGAREEEQAARAAQEVSKAAQRSAEARERMTERALTAMRERADAAEGEVERLRQEVRRAGAGNGELRARADAAEAALQSALRAAQSRDAARICEAQRAAAAAEEGFERERELLRQRIAALEADHGQVEREQSTVAQLRGEVAELREALEAAHKAARANAESDGRRKAIQAEKTALEAELAAEQDCRRSLEARLLRVDGAAESRLRGEVAELREALEAAQKSALDTEHWRSALERAAEERCEMETQLVSQELPTP